MSPTSMVQRSKKLFHRIPRVFRRYHGVLAAWLVSAAMHIPDGNLSPVTSEVMFLLILPFWYVAIK